MDKNDAEALGALLDGMDDLLTDSGSECAVNDSVPSGAPPVPVERKNTTVLHGSGSVSLSLALEQFSALDAGPEVTVADLIKSARMEAAAAAGKDGQHPMGTMLDALDDDDQFLLEGLDQVEAASAALSIPHHQYDGSGADEAVPDITIGATDLGRPCAGAAGRVRTCTLACLGGVDHERGVSNSFVKAYV